MVRFLWEFTKLTAFAAAVLALFQSAAFSQQAREFTDKAITVRLCPSSCIAVNGHRYKPNMKVTVLEEKSGWARVSNYLDRDKLVPAFGDKITQKPALWVALSALKQTETAANKAEAKKPVKKKVKRRVSVIDQIARLRSPPKPSFRPNSSFAKAEAEKPVVTAEVVEKSAAKPETSTVKAEPQVEEKVEVADSTPVQTREVGEAKSSTDNAVARQAEIDRQKELEATERARLENQRKQEEIARIAAEKAERERIAQQEAEEKARIAAQEVERKRVLAEAERVKKELQAKRIAERERVAAAQAEVKRQNEVERKRLAEAERQRVTDEAEKKKLAEAEAEKQRLAAAEAARVSKEEQDKQEALAASQERETTSDNEASKNVVYTPPKEATASVVKAELAKSEIAEVEAPKIKLPSVAPKEETKTEKVAVEETVEVAKVETPEPVYKAADSQPIAFGKRPKKLTRALRDKRLRRLPGAKSRVPRPVVIAMRHYALGLLNSGECKGIARGGPSPTANMIYIVCTDDPNYLRQFPIEEESW